MEPLIIVSIVVILIALILVIPGADRATKDEEMHQQTLTAMEHVSNDARQRINALGRAYRTQMTEVARSQTAPPRRRRP